MVKRIKLEIEPIPQSSWGLSLSNLLGKDKWDKIRKETHNSSGYRCTICGEGNMVLHAHEVWIFDEVRRTQKLRKVISLCKLCHDCKHFGRSTQVYNKSYIRALRDHIKKINNWGDKELDVYLEKIKRFSLRRVNRTYRVFVGKKELFLA